jgi:SOS-response transcriptional repressor LexA
LGYGPQGGQAVMTTLTSGALQPVGERPDRWGSSCVLRACDDALAGDGVRRGDYLVVERGSVPRGDSLVVVRGGGDGGGRLLLRSLQHFGGRVRLQPGCAPLRPLLLPPERAEIWGTVVAVLRKLVA